MFSYIFFVSYFILERFFKVLPKGNKYCDKYNLDLKVDEFLFQVMCNGIFIFGLVSNMHHESSFDFYLSKRVLAKCFHNIYDYFHF
jgi:hypothetical protein